MYMALNTITFKSKPLFVVNTAMDNAMFSLRVHPRFMVESVLLIFLVLFAMLYYMYLHSEFRVKISVTIST